MKTQYSIILALGAGMLSSCAATIPRELSDARQAYARASNGPAAQSAPAELHIANQALARAEQSFNQGADSYKTRDLAYVATRKAELAEATAAIDSEQKNQIAARQDYQDTQGELVTETKEDLDQTRAALQQSQSSGAMSAEKLSNEQDARKAADKRAADAQAALAKLAAVKEDNRGMVITLSGSVLFASNQATLLPAARTRLDQVAAVLLTVPERNLTIEGFTDSRGTDSHNLDLSQRRADAVRSYLVAQGYEADRILAHGLGEGNPVADNDNAEGRANNRRVEIVVARDVPTASNR